ncbi:type I restriction-modification system subunit M [Ruminococcus albus]|uniref:site-specific DNA-methyltransferase (adenine-specific) n=1 Tax=Ruminococcus albus 8 TaxID=246199 RepID=E9SEH5_RUMAL|nr:type I restriction-modification system subunit M [Ruminococcus albus]EGC02307.1 type I restriction-modification system, M subunit [Ruminococcus albus 8]MCC3351671.1 type I restriction-modification system subunit M [Ruminococcus albus 8]
MNKQQLANKIWESANKMRSKIEANEYKDYILGFIFYKYISDVEITHLLGLGYTTDTLYEVREPVYPDPDNASAPFDDEETVKDLEEQIDNIKTDIGYFIPYTDLFSTWLELGSDFDVSNVRDALNAFNNRRIGKTHEKVFKGIFDTLRTGLSKLGGTAGEQTKAIRDLLNLIKDIPTDNKEDYDALGFIYEYLIENFAANAGKKAGEFYTPHEVSLLMSEIVAYHLRDRKEIKIYDPTSGSGSLLINIGKSAARYMGTGNNIAYYAQELKQNTYNLTRMNLVMRGIKANMIETRCGDTLEDDWPYFSEDDKGVKIEGTYDPLYVDAVVSNPPYSQNWDPDGKENDDRYSGYGVAPKSKADYAFLLHDLYHIKSDGIMTIILPHGVLFRGGEEGEIRRNLIERNRIDAIIGLPANIFFGTGIPTIIMVLKKNRINDDVLIIDASKGFEKAGKSNKLRASDIRRITDTVIDRRDVPKYSRKVNREEIRANDYNLNIPRYVDSSEPAETWDIYAQMFGGIPNIELDALSEYWTAFPKLRRSLFLARSTEYSEVTTDDIKTTVCRSDDVSAFREKYRTAFDDFSDYLYTELIEGWETVHTASEESVLSANIFKRLENISLIDPYEAYQLLDNEWSTISADLESMHSEGFEAVKQVDPNMVLKKKGNEDIEVQDGWKGHILPFELVQSAYLSEDIEKISIMESRIAEIDSETNELFESLSEDDKENPFVNDDKTAFVAAEVKKAIKAKEVSIEVLEVLKKYDKLITEQKSIAKNVKKAREDLHEKTKETIEILTDEQACEMLRAKWINRLCGELAGLPDAVVNTFTAKIQALAQKYSETLSEVDEDIRRIESELGSMLEELTGSEFDMAGLQELKKLFGI